MRSSILKIKKEAPISNPVDMPKRKMMVRFENLTAINSGVKVGKLQQLLNIVKKIAFYGRWQ